MFELGDGSHLGNRERVLILEMVLVQTLRLRGTQKVMNMRQHYVEDEEMISRFMSLFG